ncbi:PleD family two-component system response regulator [Candidatus Omnitrophota bacterium]
MRKKIMMIDDEPDLIKVVHVRLAGIGYDFVSAENGIEGLGKVTKEKPDLILSDVMMPKMHGLDVLKNLKSDPRTASIPVIMLTAKDDTESIDRAKKLGAADYLPKPFNLEGLVDSVKRHIL